MKITTKQCTNPECNKIKPISEFNKRKDSKDGHRGVCKECINIQRLSHNRKDRTEYLKRYREKNKEIISKKSKEYRLKNLEKIKKYNEETKEHRSKYQKKYNELHGKKLRKKRKEYFKKYNKKMRATEEGKQTHRREESRRRALTKTTEDGTITKESLQQLRELQNNKCYKCKKELDFISPRATHLDHHVPISKGGKHSIENVVYLCQFCNLSKSDTIPKTLMLI